MDSRFTKNRLPNEGIAQMSDKNSGKKNVFAITERGDKSFWTKIGAGWPNKDGSVTVQLDALPVSGRLQLRDEDDREEKAERRERRERS